ncbi:MAG: LptA/OstA family protein [Sphaerochaeta sp.]|jgi:lipopolysaccharide export system protein LptA
MRKLITLCTLLLIAATLGAAEPITFQGGETRMVMKEGRERLSLTGGATIQSGSITLSADTIVLSGSEYRSVECTGGVRLIDLERGISMVSQQLFYDRIDETILVTGYVEIDDTANEVQASAFRLYYDLQAAKIDLEVSVLLLRHTDSGPMVCRSDILSYDRDQEQLSMAGNATVVWDGDTYEAQRIDVNLKKEEITMKGSIKGVIGG